MPELDAEVLGVKDLASKLRKLEGAIDDLKEVNSEAARIVEVEAERNAPVGETGRLKASIRSSGQAKTGVVRAGFASIVYVPVIHWGWPGHNIEPNPFMTEALDKKTPEVYKVYVKGVDELISKYDL